jgi:hypothetical protein
MLRQGATNEGRIFSDTARLMRSRTTLVNGSRSYMRPDPKNLYIRTLRLPAADERRYLMYMVVFAPAATSRYSVHPQTFVPALPPYCEDLHRDGAIYCSGRLWNTPPDLNRCGQFRRRAAVTSRSASLTQVTTADARRMHTSASTVGPPIAEEAPLRACCAPELQDGKTTTGWRE